MSGPAPAPQGFVPPNFRTTRLVGIFNVIFGTAILLGGLCMGGYTACLPLFGRVFAAIQAQAERQAEQTRASQLAAAKEQEAAAKTDAEKIEAAARRLEVENRPKSVMMGAVDISQLGFTDTATIAWGCVEILTGIALNVALLASGIGLLHWKPWARSLGVWTALLKVVRLVLVYGYFVLVIVPPFAQKLGKMVIDMMEKQGTPIATGGIDPRLLITRIYTYMYSGFGVGYALAGVVYPALVIWWLTRPGVKSACSGRWKLPKEPNQPC